MAEKLNLKKLAFIGGGAMGEAIIKGITGAKLMDPAAICVGAHRQERADYLHDTYGVTGYIDNCKTDSISSRFLQKGFRYDTN